MICAEFNRHNHVCNGIPGTQLADRVIPLRGERLERSRSPWDHPIPRRWKRSSGRTPPDGTNRPEADL